MAALVSSERAFSSSAITISKRRNQLNANIVKALQLSQMFYTARLVVL